MSLLYAVMPNMAIIIVGIISSIAMGIIVLSINTAGYTNKDQGPFPNSSYNIQKVEITNIVNNSDTGRLNETASPSVVKETHAVTKYQSVSLIHKSISLKPQESRIFDFTTVKADRVDFNGSVSSTSSGNLGLRVYYDSALISGSSDYLQADQTTKNFIFTPGYPNSFLVIYPDEPTHLQFTNIGKEEQTITIALDLVYTFRDAATTG